MVVRLSDFLNTSFSTFSANDTNNTGITYPGAVVHNTTLTPGVGIGAGLNYQVETSADNTETGMRLETVTTDVTAGSEDFDFVVKLMQNGATASEKFRVASTGLTTTSRLTVSSYVTSGINVGTNDDTYSSILINGSAGQGRVVLYRTAGSNRWEVGADNNAEGGANTGSNYDINRYSDTGTYINTPFTINRGTGAVYMPYIDVNSRFGVDTSPASFIVVTGASGAQKMFNLQTAGLNRWLVGTSSAAEGGANTGANFDIYRYSDTGTFISTPFQITRSTGLTTIADLSVSTNVAVGRTGSTVGLNTKVDVNGAVNASAFLVNGVALTSGGGGASVFSGNVGNASANTFNVAHNLAKTFVIPAVRENSTGYYVYPDIRYTTPNHIVLEFVSAPSTNQYTVIVLG